MCIRTFLLSENDADRRLDRVIRKFLASLPLSVVYAAIRKGEICVNGKRVPLHYRTRVGDTVSIAQKLLSGGGKQPLAPQTRCKGDCRKTGGKTAYKSADIPILLQTAGLLIINKPAGIPVHGDASITALLLGNRERQCPPVLPFCRAQEHVLPSLSFKQGPLHRLDKGTTGVLCFSQTLAGAQWFSRCLREKTVDKYYLGIVRGSMPSQHIITKDEQKGSMVTESYAISYNKSVDASLMLFKLVTGKKHQIRKHALSAGHPLVGDRRYGGGHPIHQYTGYFLHAWRLFFPTVRPASIPACVEAPLFPEARACFAQYFPGWEKRVSLLTNQIQAVGSF